MSLLQPRQILAEACRQAALLTVAEVGLAIAAEPGERWTEDCYALSRGADDPGHLPPDAVRSALLELQQQLAQAPAQVSAEPAGPALAALVQRTGREEALIWAVPLRGPDGSVNGALAVLSGAPGAAARIRPGDLAALGRATEGALGNAVELTAARRHQERLLLFSEAAEEAIWDWNPVTQQVWWAAGIHALLGPCGPRVEPAHTWKLSRIHPDDAERVRRELEEAARDASVSTWKGGYRFLRANGSWAWVEDRAYFLRDREGHALRVVGAMRDVSALKASAERLQILAEVSRAFSQATLSPERLYETLARTVAERMGDSCAVRLLSADGTQVHTAGFFHRDPQINERLREAVRVPGSAFEGLTGQVLSARRGMLIPRATAEEVKRQVRPGLRDAIPQAAVVSLLGAPIAFRSRVLGALICTRRGPDPYTEEDATLLQDLADRAALSIANAQQQDELRDREERLRLSVEATRLGTWELSPESRLVRCDGQCRELLALPDEGAVHYDRMIQRIHPDHRVRLSAFLAAAENGGAAELRAELRTAREGGEHWIEVHARRTVSEVLPLHRLIGTVLDITERKRIERQLTEAIRARDEFLSIASHELRTPLTPLRLQLEALRRNLEKLKVEEKMTERMDAALRQTNRLAKLVENLLDVSRITSGRMSLEREECDLSSMARDVADRFRDEAARAGCSIELDLAEEARGLWDRSRLEQVATNLISNAIKYGPGHPIEVQVRSSGESAAFSVADQGIGVDPADAARIFQRFERAVSARHYGGLGLGLYIARQIAEAHGGQISVATRPGGGSVFTVVLPREPLPGAVEAAAEITRTA